MARLLLDNVGLQGLPTALYEKENSYLHSGKSRKQGICLTDAVFNRNSLYALSVAAHAIIFGALSAIMASGLAVVESLFVRLLRAVAPVVLVSSTLAVLAEGQYTLPLEPNASARALALFQQRALIEPQEISRAGKSSMVRH